MPNLRWERKRAVVLDLEETAFPAGHPWSIDELAQEVHRAGAEKGVVQCRAIQSSTSKRVLEPRLKESNVVSAVKKYKIIWRSFRDHHQSHGENASKPRENLQKFAKK